MSYNARETGSVVVFMKTIHEQTSMWIFEGIKKLKVYLFIRQTGQVTRQWCIRVLH